MCCTNYYYVPKMGFLIFFSSNSILPKLLTYFTCQNILLVYFVWWVLFVLHTSNVFLPWHFLFEFSIFWFAILMQKWNSWYHNVTRIGPNNKKLQQVLTTIYLIVISVGVNRGTATSVRFYQCYDSA